MDLTAFQNWKFCEENKQAASRACEYLLFSDAGFIGGQISALEENCPYEVLNPIIDENENVILPRLVLRIYDYLPVTVIENAIKHNYDLIDINWADQIAVLLSLILGIRLKAGDVSRNINLSPLDLGQPQHFLWHKNPMPMKLMDSRDGAKLPSAIRIPGKEPGIQMSQAKNFFMKFPRLDLESALLLIRAAKLYRDALWVIESETHLSWIMLVSAIEVVAEGWRKNNEYNSIGRLRNSSHMVIETIESYKEKKWQDTEEMNEKNFAELKFLAFLLDHKPEPPPERPPAHIQVKWDDLIAYLCQIYEYRSRALHGGVAFPTEICMSPIRATGNRLAERPTIHESSKLVKKDMLIRTFEYIVRSSILKWFDFTARKLSSNRVA